MINTISNYNDTDYTLNDYDTIKFEIVNDFDNDRFNKEIIFIKDISGNALDFIYEQMKKIENLENRYNLSIFFDNDKYIGKVLIFELIDIRL